LSNGSEIYMLQTNTPRHTSSMAMLKFSILEGLISKKLFTYYRNVCLCPLASSVQQNHQISWCRNVIYLKIISKFYVSVPYQITTWRTCDFVRQ